MLIVPLEGWVKTLFPLVLEAMNDSFSGAEHLSSQQSWLCFIENAQATWFNLLSFFSENPTLFYTRHEEDVEG